MRDGTFQSGLVEVGTSDTTILEVIVPQLPGKPSFDVINLEIANATGGQGLSDFQMQLKDHPDGGWYDYLIATDFDVAGHPNIPFVSATGPHELSAGAEAHLVAKIHGAYAFRLLAKVASGTATVTVRGYGRAT